MSAVKHTPGPWDVIGTVVTAECMTIGIATLSEYDTLTPRQIANAHLIAAAPDMLEALDKIACLAPGHGDVCEIIATVARSAIRKATGESA